MSKMIRTSEVLHILKSLLLWVPADTLRILLGDVARLLEESSVTAEEVTYCKECKYCSMSEEHTTNGIFYPKRYECHKILYERYTEDCESCLDAEVEATDFCSYGEKGI